jgi:hypothetical protein
MLTSVNRDRELIRKLKKNVTKGSQEVKRLNEKSSVFRQNSEEYRPEEFNPEEYKKAKISTTPTCVTPKSKAPIGTSQYLKMDEYKPECYKQDEYKQFKLKMFDSILKGQTLGVKMHSPTKKYVTSLKNQKK